MFRKKTLAQKRAALRKKIKEYGARKRFSTHRLLTMKREYERLGTELMLSAPFDGLDLTGFKSTTDAEGNEITTREFMTEANRILMGEDSPEWMLKAEYQWGPDGPRPAKQGQRIEFRAVDGHMEMYRDGVAVSYFPGKAWSELQDFNEAYRQHLQERNKNADS